MDPALERLVRQRARDRCEYCQLPSDLTNLPFQIDHVIARKHNGQTSEDNLALSCFYCNSHKGPNVAGVDADGNIVRLFHPRRDTWSEHFEWRGAILAGRTAIGQATTTVLAINRVEYVTLRQALIEEGVFPPE